MNAHLPIREAIVRHIAAVQADEASFDDAGIPLNEALAERTCKAETSAYADMVSARCLDETEVQIKLDYILNGSVGIRDTLLDCLTAEEYGGFESLEVFLRSLVVEERA